MSVQTDNGMLLFGIMNNSKKWAVIAASHHGLEQTALQQMEHTGPDQTKLHHR